MKEKLQTLNVYSFEELDLFERSFGEEIICDQTLNYF